MPRQPISLGSSEGRSKPLMAARLLNLYSEPSPQNSRAPGYKTKDGKINGPFYGTPGLKAFTTCGVATIRCGRFALGFQYWLSGASLYRVDSNGAAILCTGDAIPANGTAMMTDNGIQLTVLSNGLSFVVVGTTISQITAAAYPAAGVSSIDTIDGYTIFTTATGATTIYGDPVTITGITQANPPVVTAAAHGFSNGTQALIESVGGMTQVNGRAFTLQNVTANTFELAGIDATGYSAYTAGGTASPILAQATGQWFISALYDSATIDPLQFASAESSPDALVRVLVDHREVWLFGTNSIEPWIDTGASPFPFERVSGSVLERGCIAPLSPAKLDNSVFWIGDDKIVYKADGYNPSRISDFAVEEFLRSAADVSDAQGFTYSQGGHTFYVLTFPSAKRTWAYDASADRWHERQSGTEMVHAVWDVTCVVASWNKLYAGAPNGKVCELDLDTYANLDSQMRRVAITPPFYPDGKRAVMPFIEIECELGVGLSTGQGSDPQIMVRWSDDGGSTWSNERRASLAKIGVRNYRARVRRLGKFRQRMYEFAISDPVKIAIYGMNYDGVALAS